MEDDVELVKILYFLCRCKYIVFIGYLLFIGYNMELSNFYEINLYLKIERGENMLVFLLLIFYYYY